MARRHLDFYETGAAAVRALRNRIKISGTVIEPCNGLGAISKMFPDCTVITGDIDPEKPADIHCDAREFQYEQFDALVPPAISVYGRGVRVWNAEHIQRPWVVTNPPFSIFVPIVKRAVLRGNPACFLLRLSAAEPTRDPKDVNYRADFLKERPPEAMIVLPRYSYTADGKTDSVTSAWFCWNLPFGALTGPAIQVAPEGEG